VTVVRAVVVVVTAVRLHRILHLEPI
jgi:hypothetical protein